jgi:diguanylate cyclase (GGDEF)-like protein
MRPQFDREKHHGADSVERVKEAWRRFWHPPEESMIQSGGAGEVAIGWTRLLTTLALLAVAVAGYAQAPDTLEARVYLAAALTAVPVSMLVFLIVRRAAFRWWIGFATSVLDVSLVSAVLAVFLFIGSPHAAINNLVVFPVYFLALGATSMRPDHRACAVTGAVALAEYTLIVAVAAVGWDLNSLAYQPFAHGGFSTGTQLERMLVLVAMTVISTMVNLRMRKPHILSAADSLTGLMNRRTFEERWEGEVARARRYGRPISIAAIDIDYFKQFNDNYGHVVGDLALRSVARVIRSRVRAQDFVARLGGEEFVVALPETACASALAMAEQLRTAVAESSVQLPGSRAPVGVTVSVGVASWPEHGEEISRLLERADDRLYEAKLAGRDQVKGPVASPASLPMEVSL